MADSQAIIVAGGGITALPAFSATDVTQGRGVIITSQTPDTVGSARFGQDPVTGMMWANGGLTDAQIAALARGPVTIGLGLVNLVNMSGAPVIIGSGAGYQSAFVPGNAVVIGINARGNGASVAIGAGSTVSALAGTSVNTVINSSGSTHAAAVGLVAINCAAAPILGQNGVFIDGSNPVNTGGGVGIRATISARGTGIGGNSLAIINGRDSIAIGASARAGAPTTATDETDCIAIGTSAIAQGGGASATISAIAIGLSASASGTGTASAMALGRAAVAVAGEAVYGSPTFPFVHRFFSEVVAGVEGLRVDASAVADDVRIMVWDVTNAALVRVSRGAVGSGGVGFRLLRIPN